MRKFLEDERHYTEDILEMTVGEYYVPLRKVLRENDLRIVFGNFVVRKFFGRRKRNVQELWMMQRQLCAVLHTVTLARLEERRLSEEKDRRNSYDRSVAIGDVFIE